MEQILVITSDQLPPGFPAERLIVDPRGFEPLAGARFIDRQMAETDERFRQVIPYVLLRHDNRWFSYARTRKGREPRLHDRRSIGVGGHINPSDLTSSVNALQYDPVKQIAAAAQREIDEEIVGFGASELTWLGFICGGASDVERVHFGVVYVAEVDADAIELTLEGKMSDARFVDVQELRRDQAIFEGWSAIVIDHLVGESLAA